MTAASAELQWFIARDGKQYGPVSDGEMRKLIELGHLKAGDLVWRQGFAEWQPAQVLLPPAAPVPFPPAPIGAPHPEPQARVQTTPAPVATQPAAHPATSAPAAAARAATTQPAAAPAQAAASAPATAAVVTAAPATTPAARPAQPQLAPAPAAAAAPAPSAAPPQPAVAAPAPAAAPTDVPATAAPVTAGPGAASPGTVGPGAAGQGAGARDAARQELSSLAAASRPQQRMPATPVPAPFSAGAPAQPAAPIPQPIPAPHVIPAPQPVAQPQPNPAMAAPFAPSAPAPAAPSAAMPGVPAQWPQSMAPAGARAAQPTFGDAMRQQPVPGAVSGPVPGPTPGTMPNPMPAPAPMAAPGWPQSPRLDAQRPELQRPELQRPELQRPETHRPGGPHFSGPALGGPPPYAPPHAGPTLDAPRASLDPPLPRSLEAVPVSSDFDDAEPDAPRRHRLGRKLALVAVVLLLAGGGGYLVSQGGLDKLTQTFGKVAQSGAAKGTPTSDDSKAAKAGSDSPSAGEVAALTERYERLAMWALVKKEFPDWFGERMKEVAKLSAAKKPDEEVTKHLVEQLVALRRQNSDAALAASTPKLKEVATAFLGNLKALAAKSTDACYGFISQGEVSPATVEMMRQPNGTTIEGQVVAIFSAIAEGRKTRTTHNPPLKTDYDALADQLGKLGWSQTDLQLFADPRQLAKATPDKVCRMVQDWFAAHIAIGDAEVQERLLIETLRPVVAG